MINETEILAIGEIRRPHGKQGELHVDLSDERFEASDPRFVVLVMDGIPTPFEVLDWRGKGAESIILTLDGIDSEEKASLLTGEKLYMLHRDLTEEDADQVTWESLVGYTVEEESEGALGTITDIDTSTLNTLITLDSGKMLPLHEDFIVDLDPDAHHLTLRLPFQL